ncbi:conserved hypothetical protein [Rippkaea orientalis PCC 8801]|uniref:Lipid-A-disaccharide synthase n=1 Tax=Rippkaea orientalis (strain PCC 8801 / RF-1) TaxID=41431 RepID=B7K371_RIPO1|nr:lipid-A-disaccharide synthase-related protein [Rippkaea orientalis]ACK64391.1 conserved hypothetical protein [Rippkaea orientalis PCC 8801]
MAILILSNGHGEDVIAVSIAQQLQDLCNTLDITALPLVGEGHAYKKADIPITGLVKKMPSGGFNQDPKQLLRDILGGLLGLTYYQYKTIRQWGKNGGKILAVGDLVPLLLAWLSGADYGFVGTAKSEYYLRNETDWLPQTSLLERWFGSMYFPWERWLMSDCRCQAVFPRDSLTAKILQQWQIPIFDLGNPMMDGLEVSKTPILMTNKDSLTVLLLPGSRSPESQENWQIILESVGCLIANFSEKSLLFLAAIAPSLSLDFFSQDLLSKGWINQKQEKALISLNDPEQLVFTQQRARLILTQHSYSNCLQIADLAIAMSGTATEQFVGLGKPVITIPGKGPQFTLNFAKKQTYLLGESVILVKHPEQVTRAIQSLLQDPQRLHSIAANGRKRLGDPGAAKRIAECLFNQGFC